MNESTSVAEYNPIAAGLAIVRQRYANVAWDLKTTKGNAEARAARKELVTLRVSLEAKRVELKAPVLERAKLIDSVDDILEEILPRILNASGVQIIIRSSSGNSHSAIWIIDM